MAFAAGVASVLAVGGTTAQLTATAATGGTLPYSYQWYRSTTSGFTPGGGNILSGKTSLNLSDSGLIPNTIYYYKLVAIDSAGSPVTVTYTQVTATTSAMTLSQNQFQQSTVLGVVDLAYNYDTMSVQVDMSQATALYAGSAVKMVDSADGLPKVVGCAANADEVLGFINYDLKTVAFLAGSRAEISTSGNVQYLFATAAIARGARCQLDVSSPGCVTALVSSSGADIVGWAVDQAAGYGSLIRVKLITPSYQKA